MRNVAGLNCDFNGSALDRGVATTRRRGGERPTHRWHLSCSWRGRLARRPGKRKLDVIILLLSQMYKHHEGDKQRDDVFIH